MLAGLLGAVEAVGLEQELVMVAGRLAAKERRAFAKRFADELPGVRDALAA